MKNWVAVVVRYESDAADARFPVYDCRKSTCDSRKSTHDCRKLKITEILTCDILFL